MGNLSFKLDDGDLGAAFLQSELGVRLNLSRAWQVWRHSVSSNSHRPIHRKIKRVNCVQRLKALNKLAGMVGSNSPPRNPLRRLWG